MKSSHIKGLPTIAAAVLIAGAGILAVGQPATATPNSPTDRPGANNSASLLGLHSSALSQANAVMAAQQYIGTMPFSRTGLIKQLRFDGYSVKDATYAVDHIHANWNTEAALSAKQYLKTMPFSRSGLINQLVFEGFTKTQATYGVKKAGL